MVQRKKKKIVLLAALDILSAVLAMCLAFWLRFVVFQGENPVGGFQFHLLWAALFSPVYVLSYGFTGVYDRQNNRRFLDILGRIMLCNTVATMLYIDLVFVFRVVDFSRWMIILSYVIMNIFTSIIHYLFWRSRRRRNRAGLDLKGMVVIGHGANARMVVERIGQSPEAGYRVLGTVGHAAVEGAEFLGSFDDIHVILSRVPADEITIALDEEDSIHLSSVLLQCENSGVRITLLPQYHGYISSRPRIETIANLPLLNVRHVALENLGMAIIKRAMDIVVSLLMIVMTSPIMLAAVIGTKLSSPGPVIFRQERIGRERKSFMMYKFRSMRINTTQDSGWTTEGDPRRTRFGSFMRRYSIDELPQLFNVLKGDMSLVGPRPEVPHYVEHFKGNIPLYMVRHQVRPGMTGWAQVNGLRGDTSIPDRVDYDLYYIENWSILFDIKILLMTPFKGIVNQKETLISNEKQ